MQVEAIYHQGRLEFILPVKLRSGRIPLVVQVPDEAVIKDAPDQPQPIYQLPPEALALALVMEEKLDQIRNAPAPNDADLPPLTAKQLERIEAFSLRDEIRSWH
ncbi:MAG: hypothetical protein JG718_05125 [Candidatus Thiothrix moscowensis]|nr:hypothetical protein [Candidatus Thiothrix moscowensis]